jgi:hypothetical protein
LLAICRDDAHRHWRRLLIDAQACPAEHGKGEDDHRAEREPQFLHASLLRQGRSSQGAPARSRFGVPQTANQDAIVGSKMRAARNAATNLAPGGMAGCAFLNMATATFSRRLGATSGIRQRTDQSSVNFGV